jgi:hypothetical protein
MRFSGALHPVADLAMIVMFIVENYLIEINSNLIQAGV